MSAKLLLNICLLSALRYQQLIKDNLKEIAKLITTEQGKTLADAEGDVLRGLQVVENLCANTSLLLGETLTGISKDMDLTSYRTPLGVCAGIAPFNFPAMIPLWMFPTGQQDSVSLKSLNSSCRFDHWQHLHHEAQ